MNILLNEILIFSWGGGGKKSGLDLAPIVQTPESKEKTKKKKIKDKEKSAT